LRWINFITVSTCFLIAGRGRRTGDLFVGGKHETTTHYSFNGGADDRCRYVNHKSGSSSGSSGLVGWPGLVGYPGYGYVGYPAYYGYGTFYSHPQYQSYSASGGYGMWNNPWYSAGYQPVIRRHIASRPRIRPMYAAGAGVRRHWQ
jgi:hypothetical protein